MNAATLLSRRITAFAVALGGIAAVSVFMASAAFAAVPVDNGRIVFTGTRWDRSVPKIFTMPHNSTSNDDQIRISPGFDEAPSQSADGTKIAYFSGGEETGIHVMNADGSNDTLIKPDGLDPAWSPDGTKIAYMFGGANDIYVMNADGNNSTQLTTEGAARTPAWSPDGEKIAFTSYRNGNRDVYVMRADGADQTRLTTSGDEDWFPSFSPDGSKIAFSRGPSDTTEIYAMNADGSGETRLTNNSVRDRDPSFSPDGTQIALVHESNTWDQIYVMNVDGSDLTPRTGTFDYNSDPSYRVPDRLAPQTTIDSAPAITTNNPSFTFSSSEVGSTFECAVDDGAYRSCTSPDLPVVGDGSHTFHARATDINGNVDQSEATRSFTVDATAPQTTIDSPADGAALARGVNVNADYSCADEAGGSGLATCVGNVPDGRPIDTSTLGREDFEVTATDNAGNDFTQTVNYTVTDQTDPTATIDSPADGASFARGEFVPADYGCADETNGVGLDKLRRDGRRRDPDRHLRLGQESFSVTATDNAGNDFTRTFHYRVTDTAEPAVTIDSPADDASFARGEASTADYGCADEAGGSGIATCDGTVADGAPIDTSALRFADLRGDRDRQRGQRPHPHHH